MSEQFKESYSTNKLNLLALCISLSLSGTAYSAEVDEEIHFYSVNSTATADGSNYNNDGATGQNAMAIGLNSTASGKNGVAVGNNATVSDRNAVAFGFDVTASGASSTALGRASVASGGSSIAIGNTATADSQNAMAFGYASNSQGDSAIAIGKESSANGPSALAIGEGSNSLGDSAMAIGKNSFADGISAVSIGQGTSALAESAVVLGRGSIASGESSIALGFKANATGQDAIAFGYGSNAHGARAIAIGQNSSAADRSISFGYGSGAEGADGVAIGAFSEANGGNASAFGRGSVASGENAIAAGYQSHAQAIDATALGSGSAAIAESATALGSDNSVANENSTAVGKGNIISGAYASLLPVPTEKNTSVGNNNIIADSTHTAVFGGGNEVNAAGYSSVNGANNMIDESDAVALYGALNHISTSSGISVTGSGNMVTDTQATYLVGAYNNVDESTGNIGVLGTNNQITNTGTLSIVGDFNQITNVGNDETGETGVYGSRNILTDVDGVRVVGSGNTVTANGAMILGNESSVSATDGMALGNATNVSIEGGVALGSHSVADRDAASGATPYVPGSATDEQTAAINATVATTGAVSVGGVDADGNNQYRQITNVAAGSEDSDAVNVSQLKAVQVAAAAGDTHFYSVNSTDADAVNYNNDGATGANALAAGVGATATGARNIAIGNGATAGSVFDSIAIGNGADVQTRSGIAIGSGASVDAVRTDGNGEGYWGVALGNNANVYGEYGVAVGGGNVHSGAGGDMVNSAGVHGSALGYGAQAGYNGTALGYGAEAPGEILNLFGNEVELGYSTAVGYKAITGSTGYGTSIGGFSTASSIGSIAVGNNTNASGAGAIAIGGSNTGGSNAGNRKGSQSTGSRSIAMGSESQATADDAIVIGGAGVANAAGSVAVGGNANASVENGVALGRNSVADRDAASGATPYVPGSATDDQTTAINATVATTGAVSVGGVDANGTNQYRQITNVAAGSEDSDAVNVAQLKAVQTMASAGWNVSAQGENASNVASDSATGSDVDLNNSDGNIVVSKTTDSNDVTFDLNKDIDLGSDGSLTIGDSVVKNAGVAVGDDVALGNTGLIINNGPSVTTGGINAGNLTITNVAPGVDGTDAVNLNQLRAAGSVVEAGTNVASVDAATNAEGGTTYTVNANGTRVSGGSSTITVAETTDSATNVTDYAIDLSQETKDDIQKGADAKDVVDNQGITFAGDTGSDVSRKLGDTLHINGGANEAIALTDGNIGVVADGTDTLAIKLNKDIDLGDDGSVTIGGTTINGNSINTTNLSVNGETHLGNHFTVNNDGSVHYDGPITDGDNIVNKDYVDNSINNSGNNNPLTFIGDDGTNVERKLGEELTVEGGADAADLTDDNIGVIANADDDGLEIKLNKNINLSSSGSLTIGDTLINHSGLVINNGPSVTNTGINAGGMKIINVAPGLISADSTDAVNGSQLYALQEVINNYNGGEGGSWNIDTDNSHTPSESTPVSDTGSTEVNSGDTVTIVAGDNIDVHHDGRSVTVATVADPTFNNVTANAVNVGNTTVDNSGIHIISSGDNSRTVSLTGDGLDNGGNTITNVAPGVNGTDAVNVNQLNQVGGQINNAINQLNHNINEVDKRASSGIASAMATAGLPQAYMPGKSMVAAAGGTYRGRNAVAIGVSSISDSGKWVLKGTASVNEHDAGASVGVGYQW